MLRPELSLIAGCGHIRELKPSCSPTWGRGEKSVERRRQDSTRPMGNLRET